MGGRKALKPVGGQASISAFFKRSSAAGRPDAGRAACDMTDGNNAIETAVEKRAAPTPPTAPVAKRRQTSDGPLLTSVLEAEAGAREDLVATPRAATRREQPTLEEDPAGPERPEARPRAAPELVSSPVEAVVGSPPRLRATPAAQEPAKVVCDATTQGHRTPPRRRPAPASSPARPADPSAAPARRASRRQARCHDSTPPAQPIGAAAPSGPASQEPPPSPAAETQRRGAGDARPCGGAVADDKTTRKSYEALRAERIKRNREIMIAMIGDDPVLRSVNRAAARKAKPKPRAPRAPLPPRRQQPRRGCADAAPAAERAAEPPEDVEEEAVEYDDSSVLRYTCSSAPARADGGDAGWVAKLSLPDRFDGAAEEACGAAGTLRGFREVPCCFTDDHMKRAYSIDHQGGLLAAGGHGGRLAVFGTRVLAEGCARGDEDVGPLLSCKLFKGWVSEVRFLSQQACEGQRLLLATSNDGSCGVFDVNKTGAGRPKEVAAAEVHAGGVFSMDEAAMRVATASKDGTVSVAVVADDASLKQDAVFEDLHGGNVVKSVRWRGPAGDVMATAGNDHAVVVTDSRGRSASVRIDDAHGSAVNFAEWHPADANVLATTGFDAAVKIWDIRNPSKPTAELLGHCLGNGRVSSLYRPVFLAGGGIVAASGEKSQALSLYSLSTGKAVSRGALGFQPTAILGFPMQPAAPLVLATTKALQVYLPDHNDNH
ncbi:unnamed protein product [Pedinophyceae sp. YPF-701]|nr:unnamed protein product [Pedinophyceae sp. YPF-701]